jgi:hypothetical protein
MIRLQTILMTLLLTLSIFGAYAATPKLHQKLGGENLEVLKNAKFVTLLTIIPEGAQSKYQPQPEVHLTNEEISRLKRQLLDDHNYSFERRKSCEFIPELSFKFQDGKDGVVHLFVSPSCNQILFAMGRKSVLLDYEPSYERLEDYFQQLANNTRLKNKV